MKFGTNICKRRKEKKLSQTEVAGRIGTHQSTYHTWESDKSTLPAEYFIKIAHALEVDLYELIPQESNPFIKKRPDQTTSLYIDLIATQKQVITVQQQQIEQLQAEIERLHNRNSSESQ